MTAFFIYSTGRCATQWLARFFAQNLGKRAVVEHEPAGVDWSARRALRHPNLGELRRRMPDVDRHLDRIAETVASGRIYVQTGWPAFGWFPYLASFFGEQFRWVHLVRHPLYVAGSRPPIAIMRQLAAMRWPRTRSSSRAIAARPIAAWRVSGRV